ncbi:MAG: 30S ribosome-binding factor RbfA [Nitrospinota bacterium]|nr:MAG: 30S ribosome-binding factor RbfA [Nitrospinota bacterium]
MLPFKRADRVGELILEEISAMLIREIKDPRIGFVTLTRVEVSDDLRYAKVYASIMGDEHTEQQTLQGLQSATRFIQRELGKRLRLRRIPKLTFQRDKSLEYGAYINQMLNTLSRETLDEEEA